MADLYWCDNCKKSFQESRSPKTKDARFQDMSFCSGDCVDDFSVHLLKMQDPSTATSEHAFQKHHEAMMDRHRVNVERECCITGDGAENRTDRASHCTRGPTEQAFNEHNEAIRKNLNAHYTQGPIECIDAIQSALTPEEFRGFCKGNALKYLWRERHKGGPEDLQKAGDYLRRMAPREGNRESGKEKA